MQFSSLLFFFFIDFGVLTRGIIIQNDETLFGS